jgi:peptide/nickel transport system ATP-binding protein
MTEGAGSGRDDAVADRPAGEDAREEARPILEGRDLTKLFSVRPGGSRLRRRRTLRAVDGVSIGLTPGRVTAVVGETGSGKSVLARMLAGIVRPTSGQLLLDDEPVVFGERHRRAYASHVQLVLQDPFASLNSLHTVRHHLVRPLRIHDTGGDDIDAAIFDLLRRVALDPSREFAAKYPHELSGGQLQRVSVARALAVRPRVLLTDEPVSMLDVSIRLGVLNLLADLRDEGHLAILYITHDIASARYLADDILVMYAGQVVEHAPGAALTDSPAHPYTQLLLAAAPDPTRSERHHVATQDMPLRVSQELTGCRFYARCDRAMEICRTEKPPLAEVGAGHEAACWLHTTAAATGDAGRTGVPLPSLRETARRAGGARGVEESRDPNKRERREATGRKM